MPAIAEGNFCLNEFDRGYRETELNDGEMSERFQRSDAAAFKQVSKRRCDQRVHLITKVKSAN
jgi:hypothetical protein